MKRKILLGSLFLLIIISVVYWENRSQNIRKEVLSSLEQEFKFCEIIKDSIWFDKSKFWMRCNNRPFYTEYDGDLKYESNGWSFLEETEHWEELKECNVYSTGGLLGFYCIPSFDDAKVKYFEFDKENFELEKVREDDFSEVIEKDITDAYPFLKDCGLESYGGKEEGIVKRGTFLSLNFSCDGKTYEVKTNLAMIFPPGAFNHLEKDEIKWVFEQSFGKTPRIEDETAYTDFDFGELSIKYGSTLNDAPIKVSLTSSYEDILKEVGSKFILGFDSDSDIELIKIEPVQSLGVEVEESWFRAEEGLIKIIFVEGGWVALERIREGFYE